MTNEESSTLSPGQRVQHAEFGEVGNTPDGTAEFGELLGTESVLESRFFVDDR